MSGCGNALGSNPTVFLTVLRAILTNSPRTAGALLVPSPPRSLRAPALSHQSRRLGAGGAVLRRWAWRRAAEHRVVAGAGGAIEQRRLAADRSRRAHQHRRLDPLAAD